MEESRQFCTFYLDGQLFGINVLNVQEVVRYQEMTSIPLAPEEVSGLINLRGRIVTAIDLRKRLNMPPLPENQEPRNVLVHSQDDSEVASLLVDEIGDVLEVEEEAFERPPDTLRKEFRELILGAYKLEKQLLLVLDVDRALQVSSRTESATV